MLDLSGLSARKIHFKSCIRVDTEGGRYHVQWDDTAPMTPLGRQEGAEVGYNPHKPGRPSHAYHTYWIARLRLCLDVEVRPGNQSSASHGMLGLWDLIDSLDSVQRPHAIRGDCNYGSEGVMAKCEARNIPYLFKIRQTAKVKTLIDALEQKGGWVDCGQGFEGIEGELRLSGWSRQRRVIVARRRIQAEGGEAAKSALPLLTQCGELPMELVSYDYIVGPEKPLTPGGGIGRPAIFSGIGGVPKQGAKEPASSRGSGSRRQRPAAG
jgi:hypothetical protein